MKITNDTTQTPDLQTFKAWCKAHRRMALNVCTVQAFAQVERERVKEYTRPIFETFAFKDEEGQPITDDDHLYLCKDEELCNEYYTELDKAHREHGFTGPQGHCPALTADATRIEVENLFLREGCDLFGLTEIPGHLEHRKKMLNLLLGACLKEA